MPTEPRQTDPPHEPDDGLTGDARPRPGLAEVLAGLDEQTQVAVATGVLRWRHGLSVAEARARLEELAEEQGVSVAAMADRLLPSGP